MNETRSRESWRIVRVSPTPPRMTSWWATRPRTRSPWTRMPSTAAPRAPSRPVEVASGLGPNPAWRRAAAISSAVRRDVPDGASALSGGAARPPRWTRRTGLPRPRTSSSERRRWRSSGPPAHRVPALWASQPRRVSRRSASNPVVPRTAWRPWEMQNSRLPITTSDPLRDGGGWPSPSVARSRRRFGLRDAVRCR